MKRTTHLQARRNAADACKLRVMALLGWDEARYASHKYQCGLSYLMISLSGDLFIMRQLEGSKTYWNWWKLHWTQREEVFLSFDLSLLSQGTRRAIYEELNSPYALATGGDGGKMEKSYAQMINLVHDQKA